MKKVAGLLISLLILSMLPWINASEVAKFHLKVGEPLELDIPGAHVLYDGSEFSYSSRDGWCAELTVKFTETGNMHSVGACEVGSIDADGKYEWFLRNFEEVDNPQEVKLGLFEEWNQFKVVAIDPVQGAVTIEDEAKLPAEKYYFKIGTKIEFERSTNARTVLELKDIETSLLGSKAVFVWHEYKVYEADVVVEEPQELSPTPAENQTNTTPQIPQLNLSTPTAMIIVGEHAAGADVAAGAKVAIAVQKWIDIIKEKGAEVAVPELGKLSGLIAKAVTAPVQNLNADAMLDTEVQDPDRIAPVVYTVGGPVANEYTKELLEENADRLPIKFIKEGNQWYIMDKDGNKWGKGYGVITVIPAGETPAELQIRLAEGKTKVVDVIVAGTDRWGTYGACNLLQGEFMKPILGEKPKPELEYFIEVQSRVLLLFSQNPLEAFTITIDPNNPFKLQTIAIIVDKDGKIVKVVTG